MTDTNPTRKPTEDDATPDGNRNAPGAAVAPPVPPPPAVPAPTAAPTPGPAAPAPGPVPGAPAVVGSPVVAGSPAAVPAPAPVPGAPAVVGSPVVVSAPVPMPTPPQTPPVGVGPQGAAVPTILRRARRKPRFTDAPPRQESSVLDRKDLLARTHDTAGAPRLSTDRRTAGDLPEWSPLPPNEVMSRPRPRKSS